MTKTSVRYLHKDHLGTVAAISDENGKVLERFNCDPWGAPRKKSGLEAFQKLSTESFTGHESNEDMDLIHMNGRLGDT